MDYNILKQPSNDYLGKPFWIWNGKLEKEELLRQVHVLKEMGYGGFFIHSRTGLETEYLSEEWFKDVRLCALEAAKLGLQVYIYDEDRWPSGTCGGMVTQTKEFRLKFISMKEISNEEFFNYKKDNNYITAFAVKFKNNNEICDYFEIENIEQINNMYKILIFCVEEQEKSSFYNGMTYLDTLNIDATNEFLRLTHEKYKTYCGDLFGKEILGFFTDEPHRGSILGGFGISNKNKLNMIPYTYKLFENFKNKNKYDLKSKLPELFYKYNDNDFRKSMYDYIETLQEMFLDNYAKPYHKWINDNGLKLTGHILHEDALSNQTAMSGSVMRYYEHMDYPGIDILELKNKKYWVVKQVVSVAKQLGKPFVLSELYGCSGWQMTFNDYKKLGDWQAIYGINFRCQHLAWYSMKGESKRDYPASMFYQSSWYKEYSYLENYFGRMSYFLSLGEYCGETLVISPIESVWGKVKKGSFNELWAKSKELKDIDKSYEDMFFELTSKNVDFDYVDEEMLSRFYEINEKTLSVGKMTYKTLILGDLETIRSSTLNIVKLFAKNGGNVIIKNPPKFIDGILADIDFNQYINVNTNREVAKLAKKLTKINVELPKHFIYNIKRENDRCYFVVLNTSETKKTTKSKLKINIVGSVNEINLRNGETKKARYKNYENYTIIESSFNAGEERAYIFNSNKKVNDESYIGKTSKIKIDEFEYSLQEDNAIVLDEPELIYGGVSYGVDEILRIDDKIRKTLNLEQRSGEMIQPWYKIKNGISNGNIGVKIKLKYNFEIISMPKKISLACESQEKFEIKVNGHKIAKKLNGYFIDKSIEKISIDTKLLKIGKNEIILETMFDESSNLESIYLLGGFGVLEKNRKISIIELPKKLKSGSLKKQALPFYTGKINISLKGIKGKASVKLVDFNMAESKVDFGNEQEIIAFKPYESCFHDTNGEILIELAPTRRNLFGAFHMTSNNQDGIGPYSFKTKGSAFSLNYLYDKSSLPKIILKIKQS